MNLLSVGTEISSLSHILIVNLMLLGDKCNAVFVLLKWELNLLKIWPRFKGRTIVYRSLTKHIISKLFSGTDV